MNAESHRDVPRSRWWGVGLAGGAAIVSGIAVFVNSYGVQRATAAGVDATSYTTAKNLVATLALLLVAGAVSGARTSEAPCRPATASQWAALAGIGVLGGGVAFALFFEGLARFGSETPVEAQLLHKTLVVWVAVLALVFLRERLTVLHIGAIALLLVGQVKLAGGTSGFELGSGERMILGATLLWSVETVVAKRLLGSLPSTTLALARMGIGSSALVGWLAIDGRLERLAWDSRWWGWAIATGLILATYVSVWLLALARTQAVDVTSVLVGAVLVTYLLDRLASHPAPRSVGGYWLIAGGVLAAALGAVWPRTRRASA